MREVKMDDKVLQMAAEKGYGEFVSTITQAILDAIGGELNGENRGCQWQSQQRQYG